MKTDLQKLRNADCEGKVAVDPVKTLEAHGIELQVEELEQVIAPTKFKLV